MILLRKITIKDFLSHSDTTIEFNPRNKALIDGSSGSGKSSILDAIIWSIYGMGRSDNRSLVRRGEKKASVCLELTRRNDNEIREDTVIITRSVTPTGKHTLEVAIEQPDGSRAAYPLQGVRELQAWIDKDLIGASYLLFVNSVAYVQGNPESFVSQTAPKRKELLLEIIKSEDYKKYYENARQRLIELGNDQNRASGQIMELEARLGALQARTGDRSVHLKAITDNSALIKDIEPKIKDLEEKSAALKAASKTIDVLEVARDTAREDVVTFTDDLVAKREQIARKPALETLLNGVPSYETDVKETTKHLDEIHRTLTNATEVEQKRSEIMGRRPIPTTDIGELSRIKEKLVHLETQPVCPSGQDCPYYGDHDEEVGKLKKQIGEFELRMASDVLAMTAWKQEVERLPPSSNMREVMSEMQQAETHLKNLEKELSTLKEIQKEVDVILEIESKLPALELSLETKGQKYEELCKQVEEAKDAAKWDEINTVDNDLLTARNVRDIYSAHVVRATAALETIDRDEEEAGKVEKQIKTIKGQELNALAEKTRKVGMVKEAFGSKGIETMVIDYLLPKLEDRINEILSKLSDFRVRLDTQRKSADGESTVEGLFITILNEANEEMPFESYSGGEKLKISVSISEALATLQKVGFRLFDETFIGLDENSTESFAEVIGSLQKDFSQVLCISHLIQIKEMFDTKITVIKNGGISYVS